MSFLINYTRQSVFCYFIVHNANFVSGVSDSDKAYVLKLSQKSNCNGVGAEAEDVVWNDIGDGVGTGSGYGAEDEAPSGLSSKEIINF